MLFARRFSSLAIEKHGLPSRVIKLVENNGAQLSQGIQVQIKSSEVSVDDFRNIHGLSLFHNHLGVIGETAVGTVTALNNQSNENNNGLVVGDNVFVVGHGVGTWRQQATFPASSLFKIPSKATPKTTTTTAAATTTPAKVPTLTGSTLLAFGLLSKFIQLKKNDVLLLPPTTPTTSPVIAALKELASSLSLTVITPTLEELASKEGASKLKASGTIKLAIASNNTKVARSLYKAIAKDGYLVLFNDHVDNTVAASDISDGFHLAVSHSVFDNVSVSGLNLTTWAKEEPVDFQNAVNIVTSLLEEGILKSVPTTALFPHTKVQTALEEVLAGKPAVLTF